LDLRQFKTLIFDCDGVVLDSNKVKSTAFYNAALSYGKDAADELVTYHQNNGGISRYVKFEYFLKNILGIDVFKEQLESLLKVYALEVYSGLLNCDVSKGLQSFRKISDATWLISSGGDQNELRELFNHRNLAKYFDGGIFGSPDTKEFILLRELKNNNIKLPALFLGDSRYDYEASKSIGCDFVFISKWSELKNWQEFCSIHEIKNFDTISKIPI